MKRCVMTIMAVIGLLAGTFSAYGTTNYWDNNSDTTGFGTAGGTWGSEGNWSTNSFGASAPSVTNTTTADFLHFGTATDGLAAGTITVDSTNQAFNTMTFGEASGEIILSNGTLNLSSPASTIMVNNSSNTITSVLAGSGGLTIKKEGFELAYTSYLTTSPISIFTNATLGSYIGVEGILGGGWITGGTVPATAYYFSNNGTTATYQLQAVNGGYIKCVKVELIQSGSDITARAVYAKNLSEGTLGYNFDSGGTGTTIATSLTTNGYGVAETRLVSTATLHLTGKNTYSGDTTISNGVLEIGGTGQLGEGSYNGNIINRGELIYNSASNQILNGKISGTGKLVKNSPFKTSSFINYPFFFTITPTVILQDTMLSDCQGIEGALGGPAISDDLSPASSWFFTNNGETATCQLQTVSDGQWTKCVKVELTQAGTDIAARSVYARYVDNGNIAGYDFDNNPYSTMTIATSQTEGGYGVATTTLHVKDDSILTLSSTNSYTGGTVINAGTIIATTNSYSLPSAGGITVNDGGELYLNVPGMNVGNPGGVGNGNPITVNSGGILTLSTNFNAGYSRLITLNGGTLNNIFYENNDSANYINNLTLMNGGEVIGYKIRVGYHSAVSITASGTSASSISAGINMVKLDTKPLTFNVEDVTGDDEADLIIPGVIRDYDNVFTNMPIIKSGDGTLELSAANTHIGVITIDEGTLALDGNGSLNTGNPIVLNSGTLDMGAYTNTVGTLTVDADSNIALGSGELAFADSSAISWSGSLTVTGPLGEQSVRFGTNSAALTSTQLIAITLNGGRAMLTAEGYLAVPPAGTIIMIL
ncbi:MAG: autotransporter-associated beta strand repeat-containing protein [Kiritimatiellae bacterium]|nr:autotransporter-associated beta strand repeat-containing protein [Kiritimatiellia bacterium]